MSNSPTPPAPTPGLQAPSIIRIYSHSNLFYWWPVWALGFLFALICLIDNTRILHVPSDTQVKAVEGSNDFRLSSPKNGPVMSNFLDKYRDDKKEDDRKHPPRISHRNWMGALFCAVLLVVIIITNVPLRGPWSIIAIICIVLLVLIIRLADLWDDIFYAIGVLHIFIGMAGYLFIATVLFIVWLIVMLVFDRQVYITFQAGQMKVCEEIGGGEKAYDTMGMSIEKHRDDLFRHWVLGLGSGDLTVRTSGATPHQITLANVLFIGKKLKQIEDMQREKQVVQ